MRIKKIKKIINLTPHEVKLVVENGGVVATFPSQGALRLTVSTQKVGQLQLPDGKIIPVSQSFFGGVDQMPPREEGTIYIVSLLTCQACPDRDDFYIVNETVRDEKGRIVGAKSLTCNPYFKSSIEKQL